MVASIGDNVARTELGSGYRHITFDERARGKSKRSSDYSFEACIRDIDAVLAARKVARPLLVGWSYGAALALHWSTRNPDRVAGVVMVDGGYPWDYLATVEGGREAATPAPSRRPSTNFPAPAPPEAADGMTDGTVVGQAVAFAGVVGRLRHVPVGHQLRQRRRR